MGHDGGDACYDYTATQQVLFGILEQTVLFYCIAAACLLVRVHCDGGIDCLCSSGDLTLMDFRGCIPGFRGIFTVQGFGSCFA